MKVLCSESVMEWGRHKYGATNGNQYAAALPNDKRLTRNSLTRVRARWGAAIFAHYSCIRFSETNIKSIVTRSKYPLLYKLLQFSLTIPVKSGSVKSERSISSLRRVYYYNRTTMNLQQLKNLSLLSIESDVLETISNECYRFVFAIKSETVDSILTVCSF